MIIIVRWIDGWRRVVVRQSIAGQCSNNSNGSHATLLKVVIIIIIVMILIFYKMIKHWYLFQVEFAYFIFASHHISFHGNTTYTVSSAGAIIVIENNHQRDTLRSLPSKGKLQQGSTHFHSVWGCFSPLNG